ncbi:MAG TPA: hypothetical protein VH143_15260 [Kofleriaceae bacterium]|nr:hypothetical protein [Kofleriaceae bacterium]
MLGVYDQRARYAESSSLRFVDADDMYRIVPKIGPLRAPRAIEQAERPADAGVRIRIAAIDRVLVVELDQRVERSTRRRRPFEMRK